MATKKYISLNNLTNFLNNIKDTFATKTEMSEKSDKSHVHSISDITNLQSTLNNKADSSHGTHVTYSTTAPVMDGTASAGTASTVSRSDHRHPTDTSRAAQTSLDSHTSNSTTHITSTERNNWNSAYTHSQSSHAPSNAEPNQNAFSNVKVGDVTIAADIKTDTITLIAGENVTIAPDANGDSITISSKDTNTTYSAGTGISLSGTTFSNSGVRSIATGSSNGTISVNTNGTTANVSVKGLGSAAYTASTAYDSAGTAQTKADAALASAKAYTDSVKNDLLNGAGTAYDTLKELGDLIDDNADAIDALETVASGKADKTHVHVISDITNLQSSLDGKANSSHGTHVSYSSTNPVMDGVASVGSASTVARSDHKHPTDTSRAAQTSLDSHTSNTTSHITSTERTNWGTGYTHSQSAHAPSNAEKNQNAFSYVKVGETSVAADNATDTITFVAGSNITITPDATNDKITISAKDTTYSLSSFGITATAAELNKLDGVTATATEINYVDGVTSNIQTQLDGKAASEHTHTVTNITDLTVTAKELNYMDGVTSGVQAQLDGKASSGHTHAYAGSSSVGGAANSANKLATARTISLSGDVTGSASFDGSGDVSITTIINDDSHNHTIANIDNLQSSLDAKQATVTGGATTITNSNLTANRALISNGSGKVAVSAVTSTELDYLDGVTSNVQAQLDGKSPTSHTHSYAGSSSVGGSATSAVKLDTNTAGDANTPVYFSGGKPVACTSLDLNTSGSSASCTGNSATATKLQTARTIGLGTGVTGTATSFDGAGNITIPVTNLKEAYLTWGGKNLSGSITPIDAACSNIHNANRFAFAKAAGITIEYSNNGSAYSAYSTTDAAKISLVSGNGNTYYIGARSTSTTVNDKLRITLNATNMGLYTRLQKILINISTSYATGSNVIIEKAMKGSETTFTTIGTYQISGWSGWNSIPISAAFGGGSNQTGNIAVLRLTFGITGINSEQTSNALSVSDIIGIGDTYWSYPSTMSKTGHLYSYDASQNATFPANITATTFIGALSGNATTATNVAWSGVTSKPSYYDAKAIKGITRSGTTFTYTCMDGTTGTFTQQDNNTTYSVATTSANGLMSSTDKVKLDAMELATLAEVKTYLGI